MHTWRALALGLAATAFLLPAWGQSPKIVDLNTPRTFPEIPSRQAWQERAREIRDHVLVCCGLWPRPEKTPLRPQVVGKIEGEGFTIEKVYIETLPGFYLAGNLYRPAGRGAGPFPAVLNPHGHWGEGRLVDNDLGSVRARCITFARQGMIAFSYDMVGYVDTLQVNHRFGSAPAVQLWNMSLMGLQTWNSIRALDWLASLPEVDADRIACTGESGGGTQTFILGAIDDRLAVQAPIVMVSHSMQGGCLCENAPGLRVEYSNMEIAAAPAPRPQILVGATGDWTKGTLTVEGPSIGKMYELMNARDQFRYVMFDFPHNYNKTSREAVYEFFGRQLLNHSRPDVLKEQPYPKFSAAELRVFPDGKLPANAIQEPELVRLWIRRSQERYQALLPAGAGGVEPFQKTYGTLWKHTLQLQKPHQEPAPLRPTDWKSGPLQRRDIEEADGALLARQWRTGTPRATVLLIEGSAPGEEPGPLAAALLKSRISVVQVTPASKPAASLFGNYYTTYNRTPVQQQVRQVDRLVRLLRAENARQKLLGIGIGSGGFTALIAGPLLDGVAADLQELDWEADETFLKPEYFFPGSRQLGGVEGAALLAAPRPMLIHAAGAFKSAALDRAYSRARNRLRIAPGRLDEPGLAAWAASL